MIMLWSSTTISLIFVFSGLISDKGTIQEAVTSIMRNGVGLKGRVPVKESQSDDTIIHMLKVCCEPSWMRLIKCL